MGSNQSGQVIEERDEEDEEEADERRIIDERSRYGLDSYMLKRVSEQEPEMLPLQLSASPLSPQPSSLGTPRNGPTIKMWDPYNILPPSPGPMFLRSFSKNALYDDRTGTEVFLISHGECELNLRPDLICGRCPEAALTPNGRRQARAMAVFLKSQGIRFNAVYSSPLDRAHSTAVSVCKRNRFNHQMHWQI